MDTIHRFTTKAEKYARYRPDYAAAAIRTIVTTVQLTETSRVADIGSGTGILSKHFVDKVQVVYAVEPNSAMRRRAEEALGHHPSFCSVAGRAEATTLPTDAVDLIVVGQAMHWFVPKLTRAEFRRILTPDGWLAVLDNRWAHPTLNRALERHVLTAENGYEVTPRGRRPAFAPPDVFFKDKAVRVREFEHQRHLTEEQFIGRIGSSSYAPDETHPRYGNFERAARQVFHRFSDADVLTLPMVTKLYLGKVT
jgi:SAM-dependent methyltransferase